MNKFLIGIVVVLLVLVAGFFIFNSSDEAESNTDSPITGNSGNEDTENSDTTNGEIKTFVLTGEHFKFVMDGVDNPDIVVNQGDRVRIEFISEDGFHDWVVDEFDAATSKVDDGGTTSVEFIADKTGTFEYYCSVGQHRANGMKGNLIVV